MVRLMLLGNLRSLLFSSRLQAGGSTVRRPHRCSEGCGSTKERRQLAKSAVAASSVSTDDGSLFVATKAVTCAIVRWPRLHLPETVSVMPRCQSISR